MKKLLFVFAIVCTCATLSAQKVQESVIDFGKQQIAGYLVNVPSASVDLVDGAFKEKLEKEFSLKSSKENGFRAYINQNMPAFGQENYDIYYKVSEFGKKKNKTTQLTLIVSSGNMNAITSQTNPETAEKIKSFLNNFITYVEEYAKQQEINALQDQLAKLESEKASLEKEQQKINKQIEKLKKENDKVQKDLDNKSTEIKKLQEQISTAKRQMK